MLKISLLFNEFHGQIMLVKNPQQSHQTKCFSKPYFNVWAIHKVPSLK